MGVWEKFDYGKMAEDCAANIKKLEEALKKMEERSPKEDGGMMERNAKRLLLEEELMESRALYKKFLRKAEERKKEGER